jgi:hypothetical protein
MHQSRCISIYLKTPLKMKLNPYLLFGCLRYDIPEREYIHRFPETSDREILQCLHSRLPAGRKEELDKIIREHNSKYNPRKNNSKYASNDYVRREWREW